MASSVSNRGLIRGVSSALLGYCCSFLIVMFLIFSMVYMAAGTTVLPASRNPRIRVTQPRETDMSWTRLPGAYIRWLGSALHGDFGKSLINRRPVVELIKSRLVNSLLLNAYALSFMLIVGIMLGLLLAFRRHGREGSHPVEWFLYLLYAIPDFVMGILLLMLFSFGLGWFPSHGMPSTEPAESILLRAFKLIHYMTLPALTLAASGVVFMARFTRSSITEQLETPYVFALRSRGVKPRIIVFRIVRNTLTPFLTLSGFLIPALVGGAVVVESIFSYPGIGKTFYDAVVFRDYPVVLAMSLISTAFVYVGLSVSNGLVRLTDPRIRHDASG